MMVGLESRRTFFWMMMQSIIQSMLIVPLHPKMSVFLMGTNYTCEDRQKLNQDQLNLL